MAGHAAFLAKNSWPGNQIPAQESRWSPISPNEVLYRQKMGFSVPLARWFRGPLKQRVQESLLGSRLADTGWFNREYLQHLVDAHNNGSRDYSASIWTLLMFEAFLRNVMEQGEPA